MPQSDKELVNAILNGDREAFGQLVDRYERGVCAVIVQIVHDTHTAQDLAQESFLKAYRNLTSLRRGSAFGAWLYQIARRTALTWQQKQTAVQMSPLSDHLAATANNGRLDERMEQVLEAVMHLPRAEQQVVMLRYFKEYAVRDIATILDRPVGTVTQQLFRARTRLRQRMEARIHNE